VGLLSVASYGAVWEFCFLGISDILCSGHPIDEETRLDARYLQVTALELFVTLARTKVFEKKKKTSWVRKEVEIVL
jgi:hypothetical protein